MGVVRIYHPVLVDETTISFLVIADEKYLSFELSEDGAWNDLTNSAVSQKLVELVRQKIELYYTPRQNEYVLAAFRK